MKRRSATDSDRAEREQVRRDVADVIAQCDAILAATPEPLVSVAEGMRTISSEQRSALAASREEALAVIAAELAPVQTQLKQFNDQCDLYRDEWIHLMIAPNMPRMKEIADWFKEHDDEVGLLKTTIRELEELRDQIAALVDSGIPPD